jgi:lipopolysaccharide/colanic/teichoic acid biosynthesis glycosyltransferase
MRKVRLDEIPQFYNVLKGTMSIVGYRPERQFYIDQIVRRCPEYLLLQRIKPGITSWGQVKYGYASSVDEMCERLNTTYYTSKTCPSPPTSKYSSTPSASSSKAEESEKS